MIIHFMTIFHRSYLKNLLGMLLLIFLSAGCSLNQQLDYSSYDSALTYNSKSTLEPESKVESSSLDRNQNTDYTKASYIEFFDKSEGVGFIYNGNRIDLTNRYDFIDSKSNDEKIIVGKNALYGMVDLEGHEVYPCIYESISQYLEYYLLIRSSLSCYDFDVYSDYWLINGIDLANPMPKITIEDYAFGDSSGEIIYETPSPVAIYHQYESTLDIPPDSIHFSKVIEGKITAYDFKKAKTTQLDINGYWGQPLYAPLVEAPPGWYPPEPIHWGQLKNEPIYEVIVWDETIPYELIDLN